MIETLVPVGMIVAGWLWRRLADNNEVVAKAARATANQTLALLPPNRTEAHRLFRSLFDGAARAAGLRLSKRAKKIADGVFAAAWEQHQRAAWDSAMAALAKAGRKAERFAEALARGVEMETERARGR